MKCQNCDAEVRQGTLQDDETGRNLCVEFCTECGFVRADGWPEQLDGFKYLAGEGPTMPGDTVPGTWKDAWTEWRRAKLPMYTDPVAEESARNAFQAGWERSG